MSEETRVLYNGNCPVCRLEIGHYSGYAGKKALPIRFEDLNCGDLTDWGVTQDDAARRLYVLKDGALLSGIPAFIVLWQDMPRYARLARFVSIPGIHWLTVQFYDFMLAPILYRNHRKRLARAAES